MRANWVSLVMPWLAMLLMGIAGVSGAAVSEAPIELRQGTVTTIVDGVTRTEPVELSYHWDRQHGGRPGAASFDLPFKLEAEPETPWGIFIPRVGNVFEVQLNDALLQTYGDMKRGNDADYAKAPIYVPVPGKLLRKGDNLLQIRLHADTARLAGLSQVVIGPAVVVRNELFESANAWRFTGSVLLMAFSLIVGGIALALWLTQLDVDASGVQRRVGIYFWAALAAFFWAARMADGLIAEPPLSWGPWGVLMAACYAGWAAASMMFVCHLAGWANEQRYRWVRWSVAGIVVGTVLFSALSLQRDEPAWFTGWLAVELVFVAAFVGAFAFATLRSPSDDRLLMAGAALVTVAFGARDWLVIRLGDAYGETTWVRYSSVFFGAVLLLIVLRRFRAATVQARGSVAALAERVVQRERELRPPTPSLRPLRRSRRVPTSANASCARCTTAWARTSARRSASCSRARAARATCCARCATRWTSSSCRSIPSTCRQATWARCSRRRATGWSPAWRHPASSSNGRWTRWSRCRGSTRRVCGNCSSCCSRRSRTCCSTPRPPCCASRPACRARRCSCG
ncbi:MAG TPA: hypothetical protein VF555_23400 [Variovorax sp.]